MNAEEKYFNPFPGLRSFEEEEEHLFFGREKQIDELLAKLNKTRFLAVIGASGSGKSSLIKSGLLPALHSGFLSSAGSGWRICTLRPGNDPIGNLAQAMCSAEILGEAEITTASPQIIEAMLRRSDNGIGEAVRQLAGHNALNLLIVVDQFEELFRFSKYEKTENRDKRDSVSFINLLLAASQYVAVPIYVVFTMRSDFLGDCTGFRGLPEAINNGQYLIPRMTREERKAAITGPVAVGGAEMSQALLLRLLNDVGDSPDQLPILQHALMRTWDYWRDHSQPDEPIDLRHYEAIGTMNNALSLHAEEAYKEIGGERGRETCEKLFRVLTEKSDDGRGIRRPCLISEACEAVGADITEVTRIVELFRKPGRSFLMPPVGTGLKPDTVLDISHESLMRVWDRLMAWVQEEIESAKLYIRLAQSAELNQRGKTAPWRDPELQMALNWVKNQKPNQAWASRYDPSFDRAMNFLNYSASEKDRKQRASERKRRAAVLRLRAFILFIMLALCMSVYFGFNSYSKGKKTKEALVFAQKQKAKADSLTRVAEKERADAIKASTKAHDAELKARASARSDSLSKMYAIKALDDARQSERNLLEEKRKVNDSAIVARQARKKAEENAGLALKETAEAQKARSEVERQRLLAEAKNIAAKSAALISNPDKDTLSLQLAMFAYGINKKLGGPSQIKLIYDALKSQLDKYQLKKFHLRRDVTYEPSLYDIRTLAILDSGRFATAGDRGVIRMWDIGDSLNEVKPVLVSPRCSEVFTNLLYLPAANFLIAGCLSGNLLIWNRSTPQHPPEAIYSAGGKCLFLGLLGRAGNEYGFAAVYKNTALILKFDITTKKRTGEKKLGGLPDTITAATCFEQNGNVYLLFGARREVYRVKTDIAGNFEAPEKILFFPEKITSMTAGSGGRLLALGGENGALNTYALSGTGYQLLEQIRGHVSEVSSVCFSTNDSLLVSASFDWSLRLSSVYDLKNEDIVLREKRAWIRQAALSGANGQVISVGQSSLVQAWPAGQSMALAEVKKIELYKKYLDCKINEKYLREELGQELFESLLKLDGEKDDIQNIWNELKRFYLN